MCCAISHFAPAASRLWTVPVNDFQKTAIQTGWRISMRRIDRYFLLLSSVFLILGVSLGIGMGIAHDFQYAPVHAHINLLGFVSLAVFGIVYRLYPELGRSKM